MQRHHDVTQGNLGMGDFSIPSFYSSGGYFRELDLAIDGKITIALRL